MEIKMDIIISIVLFILILIYKIYQYKKYNVEYKSDLYIKSNKICKWLLILSVLILIGCLVYFYIIKGLNLDNVLLIMGMFITILPINIFNLYRMYFKDEEKYSHIRTIITRKIPSKEIMEKYEKAHINIVILSKESTKYKIDKLNIKDINKSNLKKTCIINSDNNGLINKYLVEDEILLCDNLNKMYEKIYNARGIHDNYIRNIKYILCLYLCILLGNIVFIVSGFPLIMNLSIVLIFKLFNLLCNEFIFKELRYDTDIMIRNVKDKKILIGKQELFLIIIMSFIMLMGSSLPYMYIVIVSDNIMIARGIYFVVLIYCMLFVNYYNYSEKIYVINIVNSFKSIRMIIYMVGSILLSLLFSLCKIFDVDTNMRNYFISILIALIACIIFDYFKFSRYMSNRRK